MSLNKIVISVVAEVSRGKSTLINALVFRDNILENKNGETTVQNFRISYKKDIDILSQKEIVSKHNAKNIKKSTEKKLYTNNSIFKNAIVVDTPGFNSTNEEYIQPKIDEALEITDIVILVLDVQKGVTQEEIQQIKNIKEHGIDKIIVVLNKKDRLLDDEKDIEQHIKKIEKTISKHIKLYQPIFLVSAKKALVGYISDNQEKIEESSISFLEGELENFIASKLKVIKKQNKIVKEYQEQYMDIKNKIKEFVIDYEDLINIAPFEIEMDVKSFPYYFEYPTTFFGSFDTEVFSKAIKEYEEQFQLYENTFEIVSNQAEEISSLCENWNNKYENIQNIKISNQLLTLSFDISLLNVKLFLIQTNSSSIFSSILVNLYVFHIEEKEKSWVDCRDEIALPKLEKIYNTNMEEIKNINSKIEELNQKFKELKDEC
jgi:small GTP-binding protein